MVKRPSLLKECDEHGHNVKWEEDEKGTPIFHCQGQDPEQIFFQGTCRRCGHFIREYFRKTVCVDQLYEEECDVKESAVINTR